jgi:hypothetical protein
MYAYVPYGGYYTLGACRSLPSVLCGMRNSRALIVLVIVCGMMKYWGLGRRKVYDINTAQCRKRRYCQSCRGGVWRWNWGGGGETSESR